MSRQLFLTAILGLSGVFTGCAVSREELCGGRLAQLKSDLAQEQSWVLASAESSVGRSLASLSDSTQERDEDHRNRAQKWALARISLTQQALDMSERMDLHKAKPILSRLNNELVSYYGYAADLNWKRMERRLTEIGRIVDEAQAPICN